MKVQFIAEIGVNHGGSFAKAMCMMKEAQVAGCTAVKFQKYDPVEVLGANSPYLKDAHQLTWGQLAELSKFADRLGLQFGCSVFNVDDIPIVDKISDFHKVATRMNKNREFMDRIMDCKKPTYVSIQDYWQHSPIYRCVYLWCVAKYPSAPKECLNFSFDERHGLSSHCPKWSVIVDAFLKGARDFEVHVKFNPDDEGCDMSSSLTFDDYKKAIDEIKRKAALLGPRGR